MNNIYDEETPEHDPVIGPLPAPQPGGGGEAGELAPEYRPEFLCNKFPASMFKTEPPTAPIALPVRAEEIAREIVLSNDVTRAITVEGKIRWVARILEPHLAALNSPRETEGRDKERFDRLEKKLKGPLADCFVKLESCPPGRSVHCELFNGHFYGSTIREAIDAALAHEQEAGE